MNLSSPVSERLAILISAILLLVGLWLGVRMVWLLITGPEVTPAAMPPVPRLLESGPAHTGDWQLFGASDAGAAAAVGPVRATPLSLRLLGVVAGEAGYAVIADAEGREGVYRVDGELPGGARVESIEARRVLLRRDGRVEALELPDSEGAGTVRPASPPAARERPEAGMASGISVASLADIAGQPGLNPDALAREISILPVSGGGFRVRPGRDAAVFTALGLHANDVVLAVNGQPLNTEADVMALFEQLDTRERISIRVRRGERELTLTPELTELMGARDR